jgi:hypothetical protein
MRGGSPLAEALCLVLLLALSGLSIAHAEPSAAAPALVAHAPILIQADSDFTPANGVTGGMGTAGNPFIISDWDISATSATGIDIRSTTAYFVLRNVYVHSGGTAIAGIRFQQVRNGQVQNSNVSGVDSGIEMNAVDNATVADSVIRSMSEGGITFSSSTHLTVVRNAISSVGRYGMYLLNAQNVSVEANDFGNAISAQYLFNATIRANRFLNGIGAIFSNSVNLTAEDNVFADLYDGIGVGGQGIVIRRNQVTRMSGYGIEASGTNILISLNNVSSVGLDGIALHDATSAVVRDNDLEEAHRTGISLFGFANQAVLFHNRIVNATTPAIDEGSNVWDSGYPGGGNFWSVYRGEDVCSGPNQDVCASHDGIGDTPYAIDANSTDRYPLMPPYGTPRARFSVSPSPAAAKEPVTFDGSASSDPNGFVVRLSWDFGDGGTAMGATVTHAFSVEGTYWVALIVTDNESRTDREVKVLRVATPIDLVSYQHGAGFRMPIPAGWEHYENVTSGNLTIELELLGPAQGSFRTNILVDTGQDTAVREDAAYLDSQMDRAVAEIRRTDPSVVVTYGPVHRQIAGHLSVSFVLQYPTRNLTQRVTSMVSDPDDRYWNFFLTASTGYFPIANRTLDRMLNGFEITPSPRSPGSATPWFLVAAVGAPLGLVVFLAVFLVLREDQRRQRSRSTQAPPSMSAVTAPGQARPTRFCPYCGAAALANASFCSQCGKMLQPPS